MKLVNPANKRKYSVIVVGSGLAGASAAATLAELGYQVACFCYQDSPRRAHSIAAQGGINAAKNYQNDGDSVYRLFYDTIKGGDFRSREANVYRLAEVSVNIIDQCVAQGVPFAREYGGMLANRSFGGAQVSRTFYARGQTGQQLLLGAYQALERQVGLGTVAMYARHEMQELVVVDGKAPGHRHPRPGDRRDRVVRGRRRHPGHRRLRHRLLPGDLRQGVQHHGHLAGLQEGRGVRQPVLHPDPPDLHPRDRRAPEQADARCPSRSATTAASGCPRSQGRHAGRPTRFPRTSATITSSGSTRASATSRPRDIASRAAKEVCDEGRGVGKTGLGVYLDFADAIKRLGVATIRERYGNLFDMYERITDEDPYKVPMRIYPAIHYTMGGLWVDYNLMSTHPRAVRPGRGQLLRPRRQPPGRQRSDAGAGRRLFHHPLHARQLPRPPASRPRSSTDHAAFKEAEAAVDARLKRLLAHQGAADGRHVPPRRWARSCGTTAAWPATRRA